MNVLVIRSDGKNTIVNANAIPNKGFTVDVFNQLPYPTVQSVLMWPSEKTLYQLGIQDDIIIEAIVTVS